MEIFGVEKEGNFNDPMSGKRTGKNILHVNKSPAQIALEMRISLADVQNRLDQVRNRLFGVRKKRVHPRRDDKILVDWNGLMIAALSEASDFRRTGIRNCCEKSCRFYTQEHERFPKPSVPSLS